MDITRQPGQLKGHTGFLVSRWSDCLPFQPGPQALFDDFSCSQTKRYENSKYCYCQHRKYKAESETIYFDDHFWCEKKSSSSMSHSQYAQNEIRGSLSQNDKAQSTLSSLSHNLLSTKFTRYRPISTNPLSLLLLTDETRVQIKVFLISNFFFKELLH